MKGRKISRTLGSLHGMLLSQWLYFLVRIALALVFVYAGSVKLADPKAFARIISHYDLVPESLLPVVAIGLPAIEVLAGLALIFDLSPGLYGVSGLLLFFVAVLGYGILNDLNVDCGCFGTEELAERKGLVHAFYRDLVFIGGVIFLYWSRFARDQKRLLNRAVQKSTQ
ncbi:MAG: Methylamine utilization protein MauE [Syntrophorhabdaceae bacterium PtaU1.Bin034]|nr:MAG: Methylamine utilization protein MauE [Syntrophorhabdaceae bacterium PtaU1.Bin034]